MPAEIVKELWYRFERGLLPLDSAGKLGVVLLQFPHWFYPGNEQRDYILSCKDILSQYTLAIEFRHGSWVNEKNLQRTMTFLTDNQLPFVCVDEPQGTKASVPPVVEGTAEIGIIRFHGRNKGNWEKHGITTAERFDYLYSDDELKSWVPRIRNLASKTTQLHVLFNNCYSDKAVVNANQMKLMLD